MGALERRGLERIAAALAPVMLLGAWLGVAHAHAHLRASLPADGSVLEASPPRIVLTLSEAAQITAAWIQKDGEPRRKLTRLPSTAAVRVSITMPALAPGRYVFSWRALSADGHIMPGQIHFSIR